MNQEQEMVAQRETETEVITSRIEKYEEKMMKHIENTNVLEQDIDTFRQLKQQQESTEKLSTQSKIWCFNHLWAVVVMWHIPVKI